MYLSAFSIVEEGFGVVLVQQSFGFSQLFFGFHNSVAAFHFIEVHAVFSYSDQVHFAHDSSFVPLKPIENNMSMYSVVLVADLAPQPFHVSVVLVYVSSPSELF